MNQVPLREHVWGMEVYLHTFLTSELARPEQPASRAVRFSSRVRSTHYPLYSGSKKCEVGGTNVADSRRPSQRAPFLLYEVMFSFFISGAVMEAVSVDFWPQFWGSVVEIKNYGIICHYVWDRK